MNKVLKWVLIVLGGLVVLAIIAGIVLVFVYRPGVVMMRPGFRMMQPFRNYGDGFGFNPLRMIFGGLLGLGIFLLVIVGIVALVNMLVRSGRSTQSLPPVQPANMAPAAPARTCSNCGRPAQEDWKTCPYCGNPLT
jgi:hypothetical protein